MAGGKPKRSEPLPPCTVPGCEIIQYAKGVCKSCYDRFRRRGTFERVVIRTDCVVPGCSRKHSSKGYCAKHLERMNRKGTVECDRDLSLYDRIIKRSIRTKSGCLLYTGEIDARGFGKIADKYVTRVVWEEKVGHIPVGHYVAHNEGVCKDKTCVELSHLLCDSASEVMKTKYAKGWRTPVEHW